MYITIDRNGECNIADYNIRSYTTRVLSDCIHAAILLCAIIVLKVLSSSLDVSVEPFGRHPRNSSWFHRCTHNNNDSNNN